jgi:heme/copper-type cytochrome/quinol oxidase subunit 2
MWKLTMVVILGLVFGGFIWCLWSAMKAEERKKGA